ncbi:MAG: hypothetical protein ABR612_15100, partial [Chromatocurvus sp.]
ECCVVQGRPCLRSVHRELPGRVIEPRKEIYPEADVVLCAEGSMVGAATAWHRPLGGVVEQGMVILGSPRNLGGLPSSLAKVAARAPLK